MNRYSAKAERARKFVDFRKEIAPVSSVTSGMSIMMDRGPLPYSLNIDAKAIENQNFRTTIWTGSHLQTTLMSIPEGGEIAMEVHDDIDQMIYIVRGDAEVAIDTELYQVHSGYGIFIPAGKKHVVKNVSGRELKLFSIYAPPVHARGSIREY